MQWIDFELDELKQHYHLYMTVTTQCSQAVTVVLSSGGREMFKATKSTTENKDLKNIFQEFKELTSVPARLRISVDTSTTLKSSHKGGIIPNERGQRVGFVYDYCIEADSQDKYNNVYVNIAGWINKG